MKFVVTENTEIILDNNKYLLEAGDIILLTEKKLDRTEAEQELDDDYHGEIDDIPQEYDVDEYGYVEPKHNEKFWDQFDDIDDLILYAKSEVEEWHGKPLPVSYQDADGIVAIARAANLMAKDTGDYHPKVAAFAGAAFTAGVKSGWRNGVFYIEGPLGEPASAHDPYDHLYLLLRKINPKVAERDWPEEWDGKRRQEHAIEIMHGLPKRRLRAINKRLNKI